MLQKREWKDFYADLQATKVRLQAQQFLNKVMNSEQKSKNHQLNARNGKRIIDQLKVIFDRAPETKQHVSTCSLISWKKVH